jgi:hypothetical protein
MREIRTSGSVEGVPSNGHPYSDISTRSGTVPRDSVTGPGAGRDLG